MPLFFPWCCTRSYDKRSSPVPAAACFGCCLQAPGPEPLAAVTHFSRHFFLFLTFAALTSPQPAAAAKRKQGKLKPPMLRLPSSSHAPLWQSQILIAVAAAAAAASPWLKAVSLSRRDGAGLYSKHHQEFLQAPGDHISYDQKSPAVLCTPSLAGPELLISSSQTKGK